MNTHKMFNFMMAFVFVFSLMGMPAHVSAQATPPALSGEVLAADNNSPVNMLISDTGGKLWFLDPQTLQLTRFQQFDTDGNFDIIPGGPSEIYIANYGNGRIERFNLDTKQLEIVANGSPLVHPIGLAMSLDGGFLYIADHAGMIFSLDLQSNTIELLANRGPNDEQFNSPDGITVDLNGDIIFDDHNGNIYRIHPQSKEITTVASIPGANLNGMQFLSQDVLLVAQSWPAALISVNVNTGAVATLFQGSPLRFPEDVAIDATGQNVFVLDSDCCNHPDFLSGIYTFNFQTGTLQPVYVGSPFGDIVDLLLGSFPQPSPYQPNPRFHAQIVQNNVEGYDWPAGADVSLSIDGQPIGTQPVAPGPDDSSFGNVSFNDLGGLHLVPGMSITMTNGTITKTLVVSNLVATGVNPNTDTVWGTGTPGARVNVQYCNNSGCLWRRWATIQPDGSWQVDFSVPGTESDEQLILDIVPGMFGEALQPDEDSDHTDYQWGTGNPNFDVRVNADQVEALQWLMGDVLDLTIDNPNTTISPDYAISKPVNGMASWDPSQTYVSFDLSGIYDIQPGDHVRVSNGVYSKTTIATNLALNGADMEADKIRGVAEPGSHVDTWACESICVNRHVTADSNGEWLADFAHPGIESDEQGTLDIIWGTWVDSQQEDADGDRTMSGENVPSIVLVVNPKRNIVSVYNWTKDKTLALSVDAPGFIPPQPIVVNDDVVNFFLDFDLQPGQKVSVTDGVISASHTIRDFAITMVDPTHDTISGTTNDTTRQVDLIFLTEAQSCNRTTMPNSDGTWSVDVSVAGPGEDVCDIKPGSAGEMRQVDINRYSTMEDWNVSNPNFNVRPNTNQIEAFQWAMGDHLILEIDNPTTTEDPDYITSQTVTGVADWDPGQTYVLFNLSGEYQVKIGDKVSVSNGTTTKATIVTNLAFTNIDINADMVYGVAAPNQTVNIWTCWQNEPCINRDETVDQFGNWVTSFAVPGEQDWEQQTADLRPGSWIDSSISDEDGDSTMFGENVPNPTITVRMIENEVHANDWMPVGETLTLTIDDPSTDQSPDFTDSKPAAAADWNPDQSWTPFQLGDFHLQPGFIVTLEGGGITKTHVITNQVVTKVDITADTVDGTSEPNADVWVDVWNVNATRHVVADANGHWLADFSVAGDENWETQIADLNLGSQGEARIQDEDSDSTAVTWSVPASTLHAVPAYPEVHGHDWTPGKDVTLYIDDDANLSNGYLYTDTRDSFDNTDGCGYPCFDLSGVFNLQVGQYVTMSDGAVTKTVHVTRLHVTDINANNDTLSGIADPGSTVQVNIWSQNGIARTVQANQDGNWSVDFSVPGSGNNEGVANIVVGDNGRAIQLNGDGTDDGTLEYWNVVLAQCQPGSTVTGTVFEHDGITPIPSARIQVEDYNTGAILCTGNVDQNGSFGFSLQDGDYRIQALEDNHTQEYYNEAHDTNATLLHVTAGSQFTGINFTLSMLPAMEHFTFNLNNPLLQELAVRKAIAFGTDRQQILNEAFLPNGIYGMVSNSIVSPEHWAAAPSSALTLYPYDPAQARSILEAAGWIDRDGDGFRENAQGDELSFTFKTTSLPFRLASSQIFAQSMEQIGIRINVVNFDASSFFDTNGVLSRRDFDIAEFAWAGGYDDDVPTIGVYATDNEQNFAGYSNPSFDADIANAIAATTDATKIPYLVDAQAILTQDLPALPLFTRFTVNPVQTSTGNNVAVSPESYLNINFGTVSEPGVTSVITSDISPVELPPNFQLLGQVYDIGTSAQFTSAQVCFNYDDTDLTLSQEGATRLFHLENNNWVDVTDAGYPNITSNTVCGTVSSFSPFAILYTFNEPPQITSLVAPLNPMQIGQSVTATATFNDANAGDTHTVLWDWGDGSTTTLPATPTTASASHVYTTPGVYTVTVTITDSAGASASATFQYVVIYDPNGGFVTGGGWITSPLGAYTPDPTLTSRATFGFVSKYQKGANVPSGNTEFQFKVANLNFKSASYDWLVISGSKAQYKGTGTINNTGNYGFMLTATDNTLDKFRIKIWDKATGQIIYDNMLGAADDANPSTVIEGGSIVIHK